MSGCLHRVTFPTQWSAKAFVEKHSATTDSYWLCPVCRFWVAGSFDEAPLEVTTKASGIFTTKEDQ